MRLDRAAIFQKAQDSTEQLVPVFDGETVIGHIAVITPPVAAVIKLSERFRGLGENPTAQDNIRITLDATRECVPELAGATDDEVWKVLRWMGGLGGPLVKAVLRCATGVDTDEPDPTPAQ